MSYSIQSSNPKFIISKCVLSNSSLDEAIEQFFPLNTEVAIMNWNHIPIPLSYKYDISYMIMDVLGLIELLQNSNRGNMVISWLPDTFRSDWNIKWDNGLITIVSNWECTTGHIEYILNENNVVTVTVDKFIVEWKSILETIVNCLNNNNCNEFNVVGFNTLIRIYNRINGYGVLYRD